MTTVPRETIEGSWGKLCDLNQVETEALVKKFLEEQPALGVYIMALNEQLGKEAEESPVIDLVLALWQATSQFKGEKLQLVEPERIEEAEAANMHMLEQLEPASEFEQMSTTANLVKNYNQMEMLGFCLEILMQDYHEEPQLAPERVGMEMLWLKTIMDCLDQ